MKYFDQPRFNIAGVKRENTYDKKITTEDLSEDQQRVFQAAILRIQEDKDIVSIGGYAGSGKSTLIPLISRELGDTSNTAFVALTGKAANVMDRKLAAAGVEDAAYVGTIHGLIYRPLLDPEGHIVGWHRKNKPLYINQDRDDPTSGTQIKRIIVDEASMLNEETLQDLLSYDVPILLVGDHGQLPPVQGESVLMHPDFSLEEIHRQAADNPIIQLAHEIRRTGDIPRGFPQSPQISFVAKNLLYKVVGDSYERLGLDMAVLVRTNKSRSFVNVAPRDVKEPVVGDLVICLRNTPPVFNGMRGIIKTIQSCADHWYHVTVEFPDDGISMEGILNRYQFGRNYTIDSIFSLRQDGVKIQTTMPLGLLFDFGIALTVHKSQGSAFKEVILCPEKWSRDSREDYQRWLYTAVTRAEQKLIVIT